jgi:hypothetical protein
LKELRFLNRIFLGILEEALLVTLKEILLEEDLLLVEPLQDLLVAFLEAFLLKSDI